MFRDAEKLDPDDRVFWFAPATDYDDNNAYKRGYLMGAFAGDGSVLATKTALRIRGTPVRTSVQSMKKWVEPSWNTPQMSRRNMTSLSGTTLQRAR